MLRPLPTALFLMLITVASAQPSLTFMGRQVTITKPELDETGFYPKGPASICLEGPERQCYTAPKDFGRNPAATVAEVTKDLPALLFSVESGGVSGCELHFALLRPGKTKDLDNLFASDTSITCQSQHGFWVDPAISGAKIFVTADYVWGRDESHFSDHRYIISASVFEQSEELGDRSYYLEDRYMTLRHYAWDDKGNILPNRKGGDYRPAEAGETKFAVVPAVAHPNPICYSVFLSFNPWEAWLLNPRRLDQSQYEPHSR